MYHSPVAMKEAQIVTLYPKIIKIVIRSGFGQSFQAFTTARFILVPHSHIKWDFSRYAPSTWSSVDLDDLDILRHSPHGPFNHGIQPCLSPGAHSAGQGRPQYFEKHGRTKSSIHQPFLIHPACSFGNPKF